MPTKRYPYVATLGIHAVKAMVTDGLNRDRIEPLGAPARCLVDLTRNVVLPEGNELVPVWRTS